MLVVESLEGFLEIESRVGVIDSLDDVGAVAGARGEPLRAARLWGAADALREVTGYTLSVGEASVYEPYMSAVRSELGETAFRAAWEEGRAMTQEILAVLGSGEAVGEMSVADSLGRSASLLTLEDSTLLWIERHTFLSSMEEMPTIARNLVGILSRRLRLADTHTRSLAALDVQGRVAAQLLAFAREYGEPLPDGGTLIPLRLTQTDLAGLVGASRVRVNQTLGYYRKRGCISLNKDHRIIVREEESLARRAR
jgi:CRP-like cAMP-binding protein